MAITATINNVSVDLQKPNVNAVVYTKQYDRTTRKIAVSIYDNGLPYTLPSSGVKYAVRGIKADGTIFYYEKDDNGNDAVSVLSNTATVILAQQALSCPGDTRTEIVMTNTAGTEILTTFMFIMKVECSAINGPPSTNYINPAIASVQNAIIDSDNHLIITLTTGRVIDAGEVSSGGGGGTSDVAWLPNVDASGNISWTRSSSTTAPTARNIKGPQGNTGVSPEVTITTITGGHRVTITDADHPSGQSFDVMDGSGGGGTSDIAWLPNVDSAGNITWTRSSSTTAPTTRNIKGPEGSPGAKGDKGDTGNTGAQGIQGVPGADGVSPTVTVETVTGGHRVTITDAYHPSGQSFDVMDGSGGGGTTSPWSGKNVLVLGDSGSDTATYHNNWWQKLSSELGFNTPTVKAYPGRGITYIVENCTASDVTGKDLIIIEAGANDKGTSLGKVGDLYSPQSTQSTICGKVKYAIETIYTLLSSANNLKCRVMFFAPYCFGADQDGHDGYYYDISGLSQAMEDTANYDGIPCYNAYKESGINSHTWSVYMANAADHTHLNLSGNALIGKSISQFIRGRVLPYEQVNG